MNTIEVTVKNEAGENITMFLESFDSDHTLLGQDSSRAAVLTDAETTEALNCLKLDTEVIAYAIRIACVA